jgi:hypothetical protein
MKKQLIFMSFIGLSLSFHAQIYFTPTGNTGFNTLTPVNRVEIVSKVGDPYFGLPSGSSGLRLKDLNNTKLPLTNTTTKVLSVDANGDVILVNDQTGSGTFSGAQNGCSVIGGNIVELGNAIGGTAANLSSDRQIFQNNKSIIFSGDLANDRFQIGNNSLNSASRFHVENRAVRGNGLALAISCFAETDAVNRNVGFFADVRDKIGTLSPATENVGGYFAVQGKGIPKGIKITSQTTAGSNGPTFGAEIFASDANGSGIVYGTNITATSNGNAYGVYSTADGAVQSIGGFFGSNNATGPNSVLSIGVSGFAGNNPVENVGAQNNASGGTGVNSITYGTRSGAGGGIINYGTKSDAQGNGVINYGVHGYADGTGSFNFGVYGVAGPNGSFARNYGVYGTASGGNVSWAGYFNGNTMCGASFFPSDRNLKKDIKVLDNSLSIINKLNPVTYNFNSEVNKGLNLPDGKQYGFISQEIQQILPELTKIATQPESKDANGKVIAPAIDILSLNYNGFIAILTKGMQEQQQQIEELKAMVKSLTGASDSRSSGSNHSAAINLSDNNALVLNQNVPNPFAESTVITYNIPNDFNKAQIIFSTNDGKIMKLHDITEKGAGSLTVFANDLTHGFYSYSLIVDGQTIDTKKMIKE